MTTQPSSSEASDFTLAEEPFGLFEAWLGEAKVSEINDPTAMSVATVDAHGMPNVRTVLLKGIDAAGVPGRGFVFYTNFEGTKGREILANPKVALLFHWKSLRKQIRVRGTVSVVSNVEADAYYASRPRLSRIGAWASQQSRPLAGKFVLEAEVAKYTVKFGIGDIPRPPYWSGFRVIPVEIEFWREAAFRLHERVAFRRETEAAPWIATRLFP